MVIVINSLIGGLGWVDLVLLAASAVRLQQTVQLQQYRMISEK